MLQALWMECGCAGCFEATVFAVAACGLPFCGVRRSVALLVHSCGGRVTGSVEVGFGSLYVVYGGLRGISYVQWVVLHTVFFSSLQVYFLPLFGCPAASFFSAVLLVVLCSLFLSFRLLSNSAARGPIVWLRADYAGFW